MCIIAQHRKSEKTQMTKNWSSKRYNMKMNLLDNLAIRSQSLQMTKTGDHLFQAGASQRVIAKRPISQDPR